MNTYQAALVRAVGLADSVERLTAERDRARAIAVTLEQRLARVERLHRPSVDHVGGFDAYCLGCWEAGGEDAAPTYPCPTMRALDADA